MGMPSEIARSIRGRSETSWSPRLAGSWCFESWSVSWCWSIETAASTFSLANASQREGAWQEWKSDQTWLCPRMCGLLVCRRKPGNAETHLYGHHGQKLEPLRKDHATCKGYSGCCQLSRTRGLTWIHSNGCSCSTGNRFAKGKTQSSSTCRGVGLWHESQFHTCCSAPWFRRVVPTQDQQDLPPPSTQKVSRVLHWPTRRFLV